MISFCENLSFKKNQFQDQSSAVVPFVSTTETFFIEKPLSLSF